MTTKAADLSNSEIGVSETRATYENFQKEFAKCKEHFHQMRIDVASQTTELVNAVLRRMNDCVLSIEAYENRYEQIFNELSKQCFEKDEKMKSMKSICTKIADNNPIPESMPFLGNVSSQMSTEISEFTKSLVNAIAEFSRPPQLHLDATPILNTLNNTVKFSLGGRFIYPVYRTDPALKIIDVPISKLAENPMVELAGNRVKGEKRSSGPLSDAVAAKKSRICSSSSSSSAAASSGPRAYEVAGTKINRPTSDNVLPTQEWFSPAPVKTIPEYTVKRAKNGLLPLPPTSVASTYSRMGASRLPSVAQGIPRTSVVFRTQGRPVQSFQQYQPIRPRATVMPYGNPQAYRQVLPPPYSHRYYNPPLSGPTKSYHQNLSNKNASKLPFHLQIRPKPHTQVVATRALGIQNNNNIKSSKQNLPRVPVVPNLKKGSESMEKALLEIVQQPKMAKKKNFVSSMSSDQSSLPPSASSLPKKDRNSSTASRPQSRSSSKSGSGETPEIVQKVNEILSNFSTEEAAAASSSAQPKNKKNESTAAAENVEFSLLASDNTPDIVQKVNEILSRAQTSEAESSLEPNKKEKEVKATTRKQETSESSSIASNGLRRSARLSKK